MLGVMQMAVAALIESNLRPIRVRAGIVQEINVERRRSAPMWAQATAFAAKLPTNWPVTEPASEVVPVLAAGVAGTARFRHDRSKGVRLFRQELGHCQHGETHGQGQSPPGPIHGRPLLLVALLVAGFTQPNRSQLFESVRARRYAKISRQIRRGEIPTPGMIGKGSPGCHAAIHPGFQNGRMT